MTGESFSNPTKMKKMPSVTESTLIINDAIFPFFRAKILIHRMFTKLNRYDVLSKFLVSMILYEGANSISTDRIIPMKCYVYICSA